MDLARGPTPSSPTWGPILGGWGGSARDLCPFEGSGQRRGGPPFPWDSRGLKGSSTSVDQRDQEGEDPDPPVTQGCAGGAVASPRWTPKEGRWWTGPGRSRGAWEAWERGLGGGTAPRPPAPSPSSRARERLLRKGVCGNPWTPRSVPSAVGGPDGECLHRRSHDSSLRVLGSPPHPTCVRPSATKGSVPSLPSFRSFPHLCPHLTTTVDRTRTFHGSPPP